MNSPKIFVSADGRYRTRHLTNRVTIIEALGQDWNDWGNQTDDQLAFMAYIGAENMTAAKNLRLTVIHLLSYESVEIRRRKDNRTGWPVELKIRGMDRRHLADLIEEGQTLDDLARWEKTEKQIAAYV